MGIELCQIRGQDSRNSETSSRKYVVRWAPDTDPSNYQTRLFVAWDLDWHADGSQKARKARMGYREAKAQQCLKIERDTFH